MTRVARGRRSLSGARNKCRLTSLPESGTRGSMKKTKITVDDCFTRVGATIDALEKDGAPPDMILEAFVTMAVHAGEKHRRAKQLLSASIRWLERAHDAAAEREKKDRADKRAKRLGLAED